MYPWLMSQSGSDELLFRIRRLEEALAEKSNASQRPAEKCQSINPIPVSVGSSHSINYPICTYADNRQASHGLYVTPFSYLLATQGKYEEGPNMFDITRNLPPLRQARELFNHCATTLQPTFGVLHIPSTKRLMETTYEGLLEGEEPSPAIIMLLFSIFAGAALVWTPRLLERLQSTREEAKAAFMRYTRLALDVLEHPRRLIQPSTTALVAISTMAHLLMNTDGFPLKVHLLRHRCLLMSREMQIHRLDTAKSREERQLKGCNMIDVEVQRRVWWNMVASDWYMSLQ